MKKFIVLPLYVILGLLLYRFLKSNFFTPSKIDSVVKDTSNHAQQVVGGDKDEHGCIGSAGYTWCQSKDKCLRIWEEACE